MRSPFLATLVALSLIGGCGRLGYEDLSADSGASGMDAGTVEPPPGPECGDERLEGEEICDDGNTEDGDGCRGDCGKIERCGDGALDEGEACDDGNDANDDGCDNDCSPSCTTSEQCDDSESCNGVETCDSELGRCLPGSAPDEGAPCEESGVCRGATCAPVTCGNLKLEMGEQCDDGNLEPGDGCENDCSFTCETDEHCDDELFCNGPEHCDDSSHTCVGSDPIPVDGSACDRDGSSETRDICVDGSCRASICGDGIVDREAAPSEQCEDGNTENGDGCDNDCTFSCESTAECDDGEECNGIDSCDTAMHLCIRGPGPREGEPCNGGDGTCVASVCRMIAGDGGPLRIDSGPAPADAGTAADAGACPVPPTTSSPVECFQPCATAADCVHVDASCCCNCTMGGTTEAINSSYGAIWTSRMLSTCGSCSMIMCPSVIACPTSGPTCVDGLCVAGSMGVGT